MNHHAHRGVDEMVHQLGMQARKSHRQQQSPDELMKQLEFATKKPRKSVKPPGPLKPRDYIYSGGIKINRSPYTIHKKYIYSSEHRDHSSTTSCTAPEAAGIYDDVQENECNIEDAWDSDIQNPQGSQVQAMLNELRSSLDAIPHAIPQAKSWSERREQVEQSWESHRAKIFEDVVTSMTLPTEMKCLVCGDDEVVIRCHQCRYSTYLCALCDAEVHNEHPLHDREYWNGEYFSFILPTRYPCPRTGNLIDIVRTISPRGNTSCLYCGTTLQRKQFEGKRIVVTMRGRYDLDDVVFFCNDCKNEQYLEGYWVGCVERHSQYIFDEDLFLFFDYLQKFNPGLSTLGFLHTLEQFSAEKNRVPRINPTAFSKSFQEWRYCKYELKKIKKEALFDCPACSDHQHSVHIDGNRKLYRFSKVKRSQQESYYVGDFIVKDTDVDQHLETLGYNSETEGDDGMCGTTRWKAAKAASKTMPNLDETGIVTGGCRHVIAQKAVNMFRGEIYGYSHYLHEKVFAPNNVKWLWQDVICQYWGWAQSKNPLFPQSRAMDMKPALSVMHAKAHSWHCQILWGGRWQDGSGGGAGEDMEQFFSYMSRWGSSSKNMLPETRVDHITEAASFWNSRKIRALPFSLSIRLTKTRQLLQQTQFELQLLQPKFDVLLSESVLESFKRNLKSIAQSELSSLAPDAILSDAAKYFKMREQATLANNLTSYLSVASEPLSIVLACDDLYTQAVEFSKKCSGQINTIQQLESRLGQQSAANGEKDIVRHSLVKLQEEMEIICLAINRRQEALQKSTTSSKQRSNLRKSITADKSKLQRAIQKYCSVQEYLPPSERIEIDANDIVAGEFPWSALTGRQSMATKLQLEVTEKHNLICRLKEEELLLLKEMKSYLVYYQRVTIELQDAINVEEAALFSAETASHSQSMQPQLVHFNALPKPQSVTGKYASNSNSVPFLQGKIAFLKMQLNSLKHFLSTVRDTLEINQLDNEEFEINNAYTVLDIDDDSESGSDEIDEF